jgi:hypothetical protein
MGSADMALALATCSAGMILVAGAAAEPANQQAAASTQPIQIVGTAICSFKQKKAPTTTATQNMAPTHKPILVLYTTI